MANLQTTLFKRVFLDNFFKHNYCTDLKFATKGVIAEEGRDPLKFIVFISSTSLDARKGTEYDNVQKEAWWN